MILNRDVAEIVAIYAQAVEHVSNGAAILTQAGRPEGLRLAESAGKLNAFIARIVAEEEKGYEKDA